MQLISEKALTDAFANVVDDPHWINRNRTDMLHHPIAGWCLRNYLLITDFPGRLDHLEVSEAVLHWTRYYWLFRFARVWTAVSGYDAGLEQQLFQLVATVPDALDQLPAIEASAAAAASDQLKAAGIASEQCA